MTAHEHPWVETAPGYYECACGAAKLLAPAKAVAPGMNSWRVLYLDAADQGRYEVIQAPTPEAAAWYVAMGLDTSSAHLVEVTDLGQL
jgi:hypothetical protein